MFALQRGLAMAIMTFKEQLIMLAQKLSVLGSDIKRYVKTAASARDSYIYPQSSKQRNHYPRHPNGLLAGLKSGNEIR